jgi:hypothetical protein
MGILNADLEIPPILHVFVSDILPSLIACGCTFTAIHLNRYVGVLDIDNYDKIYVRKRKGDGPIRDLDQHDIYNLNKEDTDRVLEEMDFDNEVSKSQT